MFPVDLTEGGLARFVDEPEPSKVVGDFGVIFHLHPLVMVGDDKGGYIGAEGVHWWAADGHNAYTVRAGWVVKEGVVGNCLTEGSLDAEDGCGLVDTVFDWGG